MKRFTPWSIRLRIWFAVLVVWELAKQLPRRLPRLLGLVRQWFSAVPPTPDTHYRLFALKDNATGEKLLDKDGDVALWPKRGHAMRARRPGESVVEVLVPKDAIVPKGEGKKKQPGTKRLNPPPQRKKVGKLK